MRWERTELRRGREGGREMGVMLKEEYDKDVAEGKRVSHRVIGSVTGVNAGSCQWFCLISRL